MASGEWGKVLQFRNVVYEFKKDPLKPPRTAAVAAVVILSDIAPKAPLLRKSTWVPHAIVCEVTHAEN